MKITVETVVNAPIATVWEYWTGLEHINGWAFASDDWGAHAIENNLVVGCRFKTNMFAKDKSAAFDFEGTYTVVAPQERLEYTLDDGRAVSIVFVQNQAGAVTITESFDPEHENPEEMQRAGWQAFLENFKKYVERS